MKLFQCCLVLCIATVLGGYGEGFLAGTKVKTLTGYRCIEELEKSSFVANVDAPARGTQQPVVACGTCALHYFVNIHGKNTMIRVAGCQYFYVPYEQRWVIAHNLQPGDVLGNDFVIDAIEIVNEAAQAYIIAVDKHQYLITEHDILVHNTDCAALSVASVIIGEIVALNPVVATIGATLALAAVAVNFYQGKQAALYGQHHHDSSYWAAQQESRYYEQRKHELLTFKNEFIKIERQINHVPNLNNPAYFTHKFFTACDRPTFYPAYSTAFDESLLPKDQQSRLRAIRESELVHLERDILNEQIMIVFHFYELIQRRDDAAILIEQKLEKMKGMVPAWNRNCQKFVNALVIQYYENEHVLQDMLLDLEHKNNELKYAIEYYQQPSNASVIKMTSNLMDVLDRTIPTLEKTSDMIAEVRTWNQRWKRISEIELARRSIDCPSLRDTINKNVVVSERRYRVQQEQVAGGKRKKAIIFTSESDGYGKSADKEIGKIVSAGGCPSPDPEDPWGNNKKSDEEKEPQKDFDEEKFRKAVEYATTEAKLRHFFDKPAHGFDDLLDKIAGKKNEAVQKRLVEKVIRELMRSQKLPKNGVFKGLPVTIEDEIIHVKGSVDQGIVKIGTMFIPVRFIL